MHYLTVIGLVCRLKKLFSYYLIIWRNSTLSLDSNTLLLKDADSDRNPTLIVTGQFFYEIL